MSIKKIIGIILLAHAAFMAFSLFNNLDALRQSTEAFASPGDPFWFYWGFLGPNCLMVVAACVLGAYFLQAKCSLKKTSNSFPTVARTVYVGVRQIWRES